MYKKLKYLIAITILCLSASLTKSYAQESSISGLVLERGTSNRVSDVTVKNLRSNVSTKTSSYGVFYINVEVGDSLAFSRVGYGPVKTVIRTTEDILIDMQAGVQIEEVVITRSTKEAEMRRYLNDYAKKGVYNGGHNRVGTYLNSPATALYNLFGQDAKNAKRFERYMSQELDATKVDRVFNKDLVSKLTNLEGEDLSNFMELYRPSVSSVEKWGQYDLMKYINTSFKTWEDQGRPKPQRLPKLEIPEQKK